MPRAKCTVTPLGFSVGCAVTLKTLLKATLHWIHANQRINATKGDSLYRYYNWMAKVLYKPMAHVQCNLIIAVFTLCWFYCFPYFSTSFIINLSQLLLLTFNTLTMSSKTFKYITASWLEGTSILTCGMSKKNWEKCHYFTLFECFNSIKKLIH